MHNIFLYVQDLGATFPPGKLVVGRVLSIDSAGKIEMTLKQSAVSDQNTPKKIKWSDLKEGITFDGSVRSVQKYGVFVRINGSKLDGLCHRSAIFDDDDTEAIAAMDDQHAIFQIMQSRFKRGDLVPAATCDLNFVTRVINKQQKVVKPRNDYIP